MGGVDRVKASRPDERTCQPGMEYINTEIDRYTKLIEEGEKKVEEKKAEVHPALLCAVGFGWLYIVSYVRKLPCLLS